MQVEIYDERELDPATLQQEPDHEALALIEELGLTRQTNDSGARIAYPVPTADQGFVMETLFAKATKLELYDAGCIPLRVLKEIRSYRAENPDHLLVVRHCTPAEVKDPVLLAFTETSEPKYRDYHALAESPQWPNFRLIARWGDALESWDKLMVKASELATAAYDEALVSIMGRIDAERAKLARGFKVRQVRRPQLWGADQP